MIRLAQALAVSVAAAIIGGLLLLLARSYWIYAPVVSAGSCLLIDISSSPGDMSLITVKVKENDIKEGEAIVTADMAVVLDAEDVNNISITGTPLAIPFEQLRDRGFIRIECPNE